MNWADLCIQVILERGTKCEYCDNEADDLHHALITRQKKSRKLLDCKYNTILVCREHHVHSKEAMRQAWGLLTARYGYDVMCEWIESLDLIVKPRIPWLNDE